MTIWRPTLPRRLHRYILRLLRPAESAVRRLIVVAARGLVVPPSPPQRPRTPKPRSVFVRNGAGTGVVLPRSLPGTVYFSAEKQRLLGYGADGKVNCPRRPPGFPLFDPPRRPFRRRHITPLCEPRISRAGPFATLSPIKLRRPPQPDDPLDATRLTLRLDALAAALDDLPKQARRLARWRANLARDRGQFTFCPPEGADASGLARAAKSKLSPKVRRLRRLSPLRPGKPPGSIRRPDHQVHELLAETHALAFNVLNDTS